PPPDDGGGDPPIDRTVIDKVEPPINPNQPSSYSTGYNNPFSGAILSDWLSLLQDSRWKNNSCRSIQSPAFFSKDGWMSALNGFRRYYKLYGHSGSDSDDYLRNITDINNYISNLLEEKVLIKDSTIVKKSPLDAIVEEFSARRNEAIAYVNFNFPSLSAAQKYGLARRYAISLTHQQGVEEILIDKLGLTQGIAFRDKVLNKVRTFLVTSPSSHVPTKMVATFIIDPMPPFQQTSLQCQNVCKDFMKEALGSRYTQYGLRWDPYLDKFCSKYPDSYFGLDPSNISISPSTPINQIPFGIRLDHLYMWVTERKLQFQRTEDKLRGVYIEFPNQPISWERIFSSYFGSDDVLNRWKQFINSSNEQEKAQYQYARDVESLKTALVNYPSELYYDQLGPNGQGTLHFSGIATTTVYDGYLNDDPRMGITLMVFVVEDI
ncbi:MAG: hypothetical protein HYY62_06270, partial [Deltaproteobacteria bacterium]|nr:hypothetical protein [Deltaproteobacteria bacterium]